MTLHPQEALLQQARAFQKSESFAAAGGRWSSIAWLGQLGVRQVTLAARWWMSQASGSSPNKPENRPDKSPPGRPSLLPIHIGRGQMGVSDWPSPLVILHLISSSRAFQPLLVLSQWLGRLARSLLSCVSSVGWPAAFPNLRPRDPGQYSRLWALRKVRVSYSSRPTITQTPFLYANSHVCQGLQRGILRSIGQVRGSGGRRPSGFRRACACWSVAPAAWSLASLNLTPGLLRQLVAALLGPALTVSSLGLRGRPNP